MNPSWGKGRIHRQPKAGRFSRKEKARDVLTVAGPKYCSQMFSFGQESPQTSAAIIPFPDQAHFVLDQLRW